MFVICIIKKVFKNSSSSSEASRILTVFEGSRKECVDFIQKQAEDSLRTLMNSGLHVAITTRMDEYPYSMLFVDDMNVPNIAHVTRYELSSFEF